MTDADQTFSPASLDEVFPPALTDAFFEALFGDAEDGAYDIRLRFDGQTPSELRFAFHLLQRPGKCLACNLTYGLPQVFQRHPVLNVAGVAREVGSQLGWPAESTKWHLGHTEEVNRELHIIPLVVECA